MKRDNAISTVVAGQILFSHYSVSDRPSRRAHEQRWGGSCFSISVILRLHLAGRRRRSCDAHHQETLR